MVERERSSWDAPRTAYGGGGKSRPKEAKLAFRDFGVKGESLTAGESGRRKTHCPSTYFVTGCLTAAWSSQDVDGVSGGHALASGPLLWGDPREDCRGERCG
mmetsp:Transcript_40365/g.109099  ORF Transcript_40365/g.109099 Transcript_40365/m.109099 type:complete len:102 (-) Transcript_40365:159-464(-)